MHEDADTLNDSARGLLNRARVFCASEERCRSAVRRKLAEWGADSDMAGQLVERLVEENYIDERRYTEAYCESKLLRSGWGERKVRYELMHKGIPQSLISEALAGIGADERSETLRTVAEKKLATLRGLDEATTKRRLASYLAQRGFGMEEIGGLLECLNA